MESWLNTTVWGADSKKWRGDISEQAQFIPALFRAAGNVSPSPAVAFHTEVINETHPNLSPTLWKSFLQLNKTCHLYQIAPPGISDKTLGVLSVPACHWLRYSDHVGQTKQKQLPLLIYAFKFLFSLNAHVGTHSGRTAQVFASLLGNQTGHKLLASQSKADYLFLR